MGFYQYLVLFWVSEEDLYNSQHLCKMKSIVHIKM